MNPEPRADAPASRARRHPLWNLEVREAIPNARVIHTEYSEVLRLNLSNITLVRNAQRTAVEVIDASGMVFAHGASWARIITILDVTAWGGRKVRGGALIACKFCCSGLASWKLEEVAGVWWVIQMSVEPPFVESHVHEGSHRTVVI